jgi:hypothetical protein
MEGMQKIVVCGVPEHFNLPWHMAIENGLFAKHGVHVRSAHPHPHPPPLQPHQAPRSTGPFSFRYVLMGKSIFYFYLFLNLN